MHVEHLSLTNFRNYARLELTLPAQRPIVLYGANAQGKTGLLEALFYLATGRTVGTASDRQLIHWAAADDMMPFLRVSGEIVRPGAPLTRVDITLVHEKTGGEGGRYRKVVRINGADRRVMDLVGLLTVVLFVPQDLLLVEGTPTDRRRFMDNTLAQIDKPYLAALSEYDRILPQRNALLRRIGEKRSKPAELDYWDDQLAEQGAVLVAGRQRFLRELEVRAQHVHHDLTHQRETLTLRYQPSFVPTREGDGQMSFALYGFDLHRDLDPAAIAPQFAAQLKRERPEAIARGVTLSGPHRDELRLYINDRDCGLFGSRGQARTAVMALKLAELDWMHEKTGEMPVLLLDEVVAELDAHRRGYLFDRIRAYPAQVLMTTAEIDAFTPGFLSEAALWKIEDGRIAAAGQPKGQPGG
jgi:DNA replication and repair protein RecF